MSVHGHRSAGLAGDNPHFIGTGMEKVGIVTSESSRSMSVHRHRSTAIWKTKTDKTYGGKDKGYTTIYDMKMIKNKYR
jgi:hypothetical protein